MDTFTLVATSFIIAISLLISGKKDKLQTSFIGLCTAIFVSQCAVLLGGIFASALWKVIEYAGILAIAPFSFWFFHHLTHNRHILTRSLVIFAIFVSLFFFIAIFSPLSNWPYFSTALITYISLILAFCYLALLRYVKKLPPSVEKKRLGYLLYACPLAVILSSTDFLGYIGMDFPPIGSIILSALLYFILLIIAYPQLHDLHDFFARALIIFVTTVWGMIIFYFVTGLFGGSEMPSFTNVLLASFLIVISLSPIKVILKKIFSFFYPESQNVFTSLYEFDEKLEREKALMLAEMAPVFAHEIRNPLGSIKGAAQYLKTEAATEEQQKLFDVIIEEVNRLNAVVNQFLDYARPYNLKLKSQNINVLIQRAVSIISANRLADKVAIGAELCDNLPEIEVDEQQLMQVILNIAINAIEAMPQGGSLTLRTSRIEAGEGTAVGITIRDTGSGISKEALKNIFKPFFTTKERGVGLGLAICQRIIKEHNGLLRVKSIPRQGSVFFIRINAHN